jgi:hypothetical protein
VVSVHRCRSRQNLRYEASGAPGSTEYVAMVRNLVGLPPDHRLEWNRLNFVQVASVTLEDLKDLEENV